MTQEGLQETDWRGPEKRAQREKHQGGWKGGDHIQSQTQQRGRWLEPGVVDPSRKQRRRSGQLVGNGPRI